MSGRSLVSLVIATNSGRAMRSGRPKSIHLLCGRPMMAYVLDALSEIGVSDSVVVTGAGERVAKRMQTEPLDLDTVYVEQLHDRGTADAALAGLSGFDDLLDEGDVVVIPADLPLIDADVLDYLVSRHRTSGAVCTVLTRPSVVTDTHVVARDGRGRVSGLQPLADLVPSEPGVPVTSGHETVTGVYCMSRSVLAPALRRIPLSGAHARQDLPGVVAVLAESGHPVVTAQVPADPSLEPVDSRLDLATAEAALRRRTNLAWLERGVTMVDPERTYIDATVTLGDDVTIFPGTLLQGRTVVGDGCEIGPDTRLVDVAVGEGSVVEKTIARSAVIGSGARVGPFAALDPGSRVGDGAVTGPFYAARVDD